MTADDCFPKRLAIPAVIGPDGQLQCPSIELDLIWHLCSDFPVMAGLNGLGGVNSKRPCLFCRWQRGQNEAPAADRSSSMEQREWAGQHLRPFIEAKKKVSNCASSSFVQVYVTCSPYVSRMSCVIGHDRKLVLKVKEAADALRAHRKATPVNPKLAEELESSLQAAKANRTIVLKTLASTLKEDAMLAAAMSEPARVQPIVACMAERHKELVPYCDAKELYNDAHAKFFRRISALKEHEEAVARLHTARAAVDALHSDTESAAYKAASKTQDGCESQERKGTRPFRICTT
jgi:hypothetical protein